MSLRSVIQKRTDFLPDSSRKTRRAKRRTGTTARSVGSVGLEPLEKRLLLSAAHVALSGLTAPHDDGGGAVIVLERGDIGAEAGVVRGRRTGIHGTKWQDTNGNARRDINEPGLPGVTIYVDRNNNGVLAWISQIGSAVGRTVMCLAA